MKTYLILAAGLLSFTQTSAQKQGTITYLETVKMDIQLDSATLAMVGNLPNETSVQRVLLFNEEGSLYTMAPKKENEDKGAEVENGRRIEIKMNAPNEKVYTDLKNNRTVEQRDFMGKLFLIDTALTKAEWKLTGKKKSLLNYPCQQAMKVEKQDTVFAWFTPALPVSSGPDGIWGLPGMALEMEMNHGQVKVVAQKVDLQQPDSKAMVKPKEGKKVKPHEYKQIVEEKTKEMQEQNGGKGNVIIKIERR